MVCALPRPKGAKHAIAPKLLVKQCLVPPPFHSLIAKAWCWFLVCLLRLIFALVVVYKGFLVLNWDDHMVWVMPIYSALSIAMAEISFRTYEAWFMNMRDINLPRRDPVTARKA